MDVSAVLLKVFIGINQNMHQLDNLMTKAMNDTVKSVHAYKDKQIGGYHNQAYVNIGKGIAGGGFSLAGSVITNPTTKTVCETFGKVFPSIGDVVNTFGQATIVKAQIEGDLKSRNQLEVERTFKQEISGMRSKIDDSLSKVEDQENRAYHAGG